MILYIQPMSDGMGRELAYLSSHATNRYFIPNWGSYYQMLYTNLPDDYPSKKEWMRKGFPGLMELPGIKRICGELLPEMPQMADTLQGYMEQCDALIQYLK